MGAKHSLACIDEDKVMLHVRLTSCRIAVSIAVVLTFGLALMSVAQPSTSYAGTNLELTRIAGNSRIETAAKVAQQFWPSPNVVFVARYDVAADALAAGSLDEGPILLARPDGIGNDASLEYLRSKHPSQVIALGGQGAVPETVLQEFAQAAAGASTARIQGENRQETSLEIAKRSAQGKCPTEIYLAGAFGSDGQGSPDAVAAGALSNPLLLVSESSGLTANQRQYVDSCVAQGTQVAQLGGRNLHYPAAFSLDGANRYETAAAISGYAQSSRVWQPMLSAFGYGVSGANKGEAPSRTRVIVARGDNFADAIVAGSVPFASILLTNSQTLAEAAGGMLLGNSANSTVYIFGGEGAVAASVEQEIISALQGNWIPWRLRPTISEPEKCPVTKPEWESQGLQHVALVGLRCVSRDIGGFRWISGKRGNPNTDSGDHPRGLAIDLPIAGAGPWSSQAAIDYGNRIVSYFTANGELLHVKYIIFRNTIYQASGFEGELMKEPELATNVTQDHFDHVHISFFDPAELEMMEQP